MTVGTGLTGCLDGGILPFCPKLVLLLSNTHSISISRASQYTQASIGIHPPSIPHPSQSMLCFPSHRSMSFRHLSRQHLLLGSSSRLYFMSRAHCTSHCVALSVPTFPSAPSVDCLSVNSFSIIFVLIAKHDFIDKCSYDTSIYSIKK